MASPENPRPADQLPPKPGAEIVAATATGDVAERRRVIRNVVVLSAAFMVHFTAFQGAGNLQSSVNAELGTVALSTIYASLILSNVFLPVLVIRWLGCKWAVAVSLVAYMPYIAAHFHVGWGTLVPAAAVVGLGGGPLWCAKCTYLTVVARAYGRTSGDATDVLIVRFMGIFFMIFQFAQVWGNLISSLVFSSGNSGNGGNTGDMGDLCGANYYAPDAKEDNSTHAVPPSEAQLNTVAGIYLGCMVLAVAIVAFGVDSLSRPLCMLDTAGKVLEKLLQPRLLSAVQDAGDLSPMQFGFRRGRSSIGAIRYDEDKREGSGSGLYGVRLLAVTLRLLRQRDQLLLLPITIFLGVEQAFIGADFTAAFVSCAWGISNIGYVMICYGVVNSASAVGAGWLVKLTGRLPVVAGAALLHAALLLTLLLWRPHSDDRVLYFVISGLWGACDGVWLVQVNALCGILFPGEEEAAFSNFRLWESLGYIVAYAYSAFIITYVKIYILMFLLVLGVALYVVIEMFQKKRLAKVAIS